MTVRACTPRVERPGKGQGTPLTDPLRVNAIEARLFHHEKTAHRDATGRRETA